MNEQVVTRTLTRPQDSLGRRLVAVNVVEIELTNGRKLRLSDSTAKVVDVVKSLRDANGYVEFEVLGEDEPVQVNPAHVVLVREVRQRTGKAGFA